MSIPALALLVLLTIGSGLGVVFSRSAIYSAFCLVLCFFGLAGIYLLWGASFISMVQILIYTGAIVVLFVFVVMLLELGKGVGRPLAGWVFVAASGVTVWFLSLVLLRILNRSKPLATLAPATYDIRTTAKLLFAEYLWPFEILSLFLLALIVGVYVLTREAPKEGP